MIKLRKIKFKNHPILNNLELDFCGVNGKAVDSIIFAGENGCGKSTILNAIYLSINYDMRYISFIEWEDNNIIDFANIQQNGDNLLGIHSGKTVYGSISFSRFAKGITGIFSDVDINFHTDEITTVTSKNIDLEKNSRRSNTNLTKEINQLLVDVQNLDDADISRAYRTAKKLGKDTNTLNVPERMSRFKNAFAQMFSTLSYDRIDNRNGHKSIIFKKNSKEIPINSLSSGEKQIVYRGCFLLKDKSALDGAFVFIDEPEISLHPNWQKNIMDYYKGIFTNENGEQTSQIFAVTHSPFIIHNENRKNDKIIVLKRDDEGIICIEDHPEYYDCSSTKVIQDAYNISDFKEHQYDATHSCVYLEGRTDEKYFNKAVEVFGYADLPFQFKWVGYIDENNQERFTGFEALDRTYDFLLANPSQNKNIVLYDCDTKKKERKTNNVYSQTMPTFINSKKMKKGIENALNLEDIDTNQFYSKKEKEGDYGDSKVFTEFKKMDFCNYICSLNTDQLKTIFCNLKTVIDKLIGIFKADE